MPHCLTLNIISNGSKVKWTNPGKGVALSPTPWCSRYRKGSLRVTLDNGRPLSFYFTLYHGLDKSDIGLGVRVFANGPGDLGSIPGRVIPKTQKMVLDASLLSTQHYKVRIKGKVEQSSEGVAPSPTHWCRSYRKGSLQVTLDYGRQLFFIYIKHTLKWGL